MLSVQLLPQKVCNLKIIAHFSIGETVYKINKYTSVMILYHRGVSLSEQHTHLLICHCTKQDLSRTSRYVDKSSPEIISQVLHTYANS